MTNHDDSASAEMQVCRVILGKCSKLLYLGQVDPLLEKLDLQAVIGCVRSYWLEVELHLALQLRIPIGVPLPAMTGDNSVKAQLSFNTLYLYRCPCIQSSVGCWQPFLLRIYDEQMPASICMQQHEADSMGLQASTSCMLTSA